MNIREIVKKYLKEQGFNGLYSDNGCGCLLDDLMPCDEPGIDCEAGYKVPCPGPEDCPANGDCEWHVSPKKKE